MPSGRDTLLAAKLGLKRKNDAHDSAAIFGHFRDARRLEGQLEGNITHLLVRARLVLVHSAGRRQHQRRRGVLAVLPEVARQAAARVLRRHHRAGAGAARAAARRHADRRHGLRHRQLQLRQHARACGERYAAAGRRLRVHRPGVLVGRVLRDAQRLRRRRAWSATALDQPAQAPAARRRYWEHRAQRAARVFVVHLPHDQPRDARAVHAPGAIRCA